MENPKRSEKSRMTAFLLCTFFGMLGAHRLYVNKYGSAVTQLVMSMSFYLTAVSAIWVLVDWFMIISGTFTDDKKVKL